MCGVKKGQLKRDHAKTQCIMFRIAMDFTVYTSTNFIGFERIMSNYSCCIFL